MNNLRNSVTLIGNLGKDPDYRSLENGKQIAKLSLATNETYKTESGEKVTQTQWHQCVAWGKTADLMYQLLKKGKTIAVRGKLVYRNYEDKNNQKRTISEVVVDEFLLVGPNN
ncbi:MAG: single-stranded DNA-binding protein [Bacteroidota bacterium]